MHPIILFAMDVISWLIAKSSILQFSNPSNLIIVHCRYSVFSFIDSNATDAMFFSFTGSRDGLFLSFIEGDGTKSSDPGCGDGCFEGHSQLRLSN